MRSFLNTLLVVAQIASLATIAYLLRENSTLKRTVKTRSMSRTQQATATATPTLNGKANSGNNKKRITIKREISSLPQMKRAVKHRRLAKAEINPARLESSIDYNVLFNRRPSAPYKETLKFSSSKLTIVVFKSAMTDSNANLKATLANIDSLYPSARRVFNTNESEPVNSILSRVTTKYFLFLEEGVMLSDRFNENIHHLWDALERHPEIDFIGGSYLSRDQLHVVCHRYRLCSWTFSESYEYERSLGNIMICDGTSSTFMGRSASVNKIQGFDSELHRTLIVKDFFLRAKPNKNVIIGTIPYVVFLKDQHVSLHEQWKSKKVTKDLIPFAVKHKIYKFRDTDGNTIDLCSEKSPLSGRHICQEEQAHKLMLDGGHWAYKGTQAYPFMLHYLKKSLAKVTEFLEKHNVQYVIFGGVLLGAIKMRSILPWEAGDIDIRVYGMNLDQLMSLMQPWATKNGYLHHTYHGESFHIFCTPREVAGDSGGLVTVFPLETGKVPDFVRIKTNGLWVRYDRDLANSLLEKYGEDFLQHKVYEHDEIIECKIRGHNACLPNFKSLYDGKAGTLKEFYCHT